MMMGMPVNNFDELAQSAISELTNMLTANAATNLSSQNISINISTPTLIDGDFKSNSNLAKLISAELAIDNMDFQVSISLDHGYIN
ncbi:CheY-P phosphatase CheX [compost metagenome]